MDFIWFTDENSRQLCLKFPRSCVCAGYARKETDCAGASAADTLDFQQVADGVHGRVYVAETDLIGLFVDPGVKINDACYQTKFHDVGELK